MREFPVSREAQWWDLGEFGIAHDLLLNVHEEGVKPY